MSRHAEDLSDRPERCRVGDPGAFARTADPTRPAAHARPTLDPKRGALRPARRHRLAPAAAAVPAMDRRVRSSPALAASRRLAPDQRCAPRPSADARRPEPAADGGDHRQPNGPDQRGRRRAGLRRWQADQRPQAPSRGRHARLSSTCPCPCRQRARPPSLCSTA